MTGTLIEVRRESLRDFLGARLYASEADRDLASLLLAVAAAARSIAGVVARGALAEAGRGAGAVNVHGEVQKPLDLIANEIFLRACERDGVVAGMVSEELDEPYAIPERYPRGRYLLAFDPLDGSSNIDVDVTVGSIFSVLRHAGDEPPCADDFLQAGNRQVAAGYALYGPATMLVLSIGEGVHGFTLDAGSAEFVLTHPAMRIDPDAGEFAINASNARFWQPAVKRYVADCQAGRDGHFGRDFNMRWIASLVAEVHRILMRGGVYLYPRDEKLPARAGRLRLLYEANPMAMLVEQAGGRASTGREQLQQLLPDAIHQRIPLILGARNDVERIERYHRESDDGSDRPFASPLFHENSLFLPEAR
ncbi:class 1 fructose-bisphosphatase [Rhodanobacter sp. PCA2]|uniref:class 1 fructose-bisphosphatase n=1 Tax=Rhodanobacter sp. PCA2 TaxID=2006117 RepID=UPI0015E6DEC4|nr:class 1 fructose-bisphosphatase [Rhodanobacter sp. PCA2]MBA2078369.1 fructose-bisphosphatase class I [Rhodanobacter sp. PCA2]